MEATVVKSQAQSPVERIRRVPSIHPFFYVFPSFAFPLFPILGFSLAIYFPAFS